MNIKDARWHNQSHHHLSNNQNAPSMRVMLELLNTWYKNSFSKISFYLEVNFLHQISNLRRIIHIILGHSNTFGDYFYDFNEHYFRFCRPSSSHFCGQFIKYSFESNTISNKKKWNNQDESGCQLIIINWFLFLSVSFKISLHVSTCKISLSGLNPIQNSGIN